MSEPFDQLVTALKAHHVSLTKPRQIVFQALQNQEPQTTHELFLHCHGQIDRASLYRTIALFETLGIVQRLQFGWKYKLELSNNFQEHHHHLTCRQCGIVIPLPEDSLLESRLKQLAEQKGFQAEDHQIEIRGLCLNCQG